MFKKAKKLRELEVSKLFFSNKHTVVCLPEKNSSKRLPNT